jgi:hypothetical protein
VVQQFCKDVISFLESEYSDDYSFKIKRRVTIPNIHRNGFDTTCELEIKVSPNYTIQITTDRMQQIFEMYYSKEYLGYRNQYAWQKELIDIIEGS